jgi:hypothetical protein
VNRERGDSWMVVSLYPVSHACANCAP